MLQIDVDRRCAVLAKYVKGERVGLAVYTVWICSFQLCSIPLASGGAVDRELLDYKLRSKQIKSRSAMILSLVARCEVLLPDSGRVGVKVIGLFDVAFCRKSYGTSAR